MSYTPLCRDISQLITLPLQLVPRLFSTNGRMAEKGLGRRLDSGHSRSFASCLAHVVTIFVFLTIMNVINYSVYSRATTNFALFFVKCSGNSRGTIKQGAALIQANTVYVLYACTMYYICSTYNIIILCSMY